LIKSFKEKQLETSERLGIRPEQVPRNIAIIMDGNGRWAQRRGLPRIAGHRQGGKTVERIALDCVALGIESLTLYAFSTENWKRPAEEIEALMKLYRQYIVGIRPMMMKNSVKLLHVGREQELPEKLLADLRESVEMTSKNEGMVLGLALNYSGRMEIVDAVKKITKKCTEGQLDPELIDDDNFREHLYKPAIEDPDLLIRTASEMRVSNFLLWQISYSEFYVTDTYWPDFDMSELEKAILAYSQRNRRFGDIKPTK
jgi:undecaprenyl diphosphate synthase